MYDHRQQDWIKYNYSNLTEKCKSKNKPKWAKGLSDSNQMYDMAIVKQEDVNATYLDSDNLDDYKKQTKCASQQLKWGLTSAAPSKSKRHFPSYISDLSGTTINKKKLRKDMRLNAKSCFLNVCVW